MSGQDAFSGFLAKHGITVSEAARQLDYSRQFVDLIVKKGTRPNLAGRKKIAVWTSQEVPESVWETAEEKRPKVRPFTVQKRKPASTTRKSA